MNSWWYAVDTSKVKDELNPLLPYIAGIIENIGEPTFHTIKEELERELEKSLTDLEIAKALESGIKLGVFNEHREFKVCREFTTKEIKKSKICRDFRIGELSAALAFRPNRSLFNYVKTQRERRKNKMHKKGKKTKTPFSDKFMKGGNMHLYKYLCTKCKRSVEKEIEDQLASGTSSDDDEVNASPTSMKSGKSSSPPDNSHLGCKFSEDIEKPPKSRLLIERNPMETDQPYYDIFT